MAILKNRRHFLAQRRRMVNVLMHLDLMPPHAWQAVVAHRNIERLGKSDRGSLDHKREKTERATRLGKPQPPRARSPAQPKILKPQRA